MAWLLPLITRLVTWFAPRLLAGAVDYLEKCLRLVEDAERIEDAAARRRCVMEQLGGYGVIPGWALRAVIELCVILHHMGVTYTAMQALEELVRSQAQLFITGEFKLMAVLTEFGKIFPNVPESAARLLVEMILAKIQGTSNGAA